jgi:predicted XRE-type DNA-binding protein
MGMTRPRLNDLLQGNLGQFSIDVLVNLATAAGLTLEIHLATAA